MFARACLVVCVLLGLPFVQFACASRDARAALEPVRVLEILVLDAHTGFPLRGVVVIAGNRLFVVDGAVRIHGVPGPVMIHAWKPGWAPSYPRLYPVGPVSITLSRTSFADN